MSNTYTYTIEVILRKSENSWERLKTSMEHLKTSDIILRKCLHSGWLCNAQGVVMHKSYNQAENIRKQQRTSENSWLHWKTFKIIWYHPENNWGPTIDNLVQLEENFNSRKTSSENSQKTVRKHRETAENVGKHLKSSDIILRTTEDPS